jgi:hypothetical protein
MTVFSATSSGCFVQGLSLFNLWLWTGPDKRDFRKLALFQPVCGPEVEGLVSKRLPRSILSINYQLICRSTAECLHGGILSSQSRVGPYFSA